MTKTRIKKLPNQLTVCRILLVIPFVFLFSAPLFSSPHTFPTFQDLDWKLICVLIAGIIFIIAMITDFLDGKIARKHNGVSNFGKFFDPIADKFITNSAIVIFAIYQVIPIWLVIPILLRDILIDGIRMYLSSKEMIMAASIWGKIKTIVFTFALVILFFITPLWSYGKFTSSVIYDNNLYIWILNIPMIIGTIFALVSGYLYLRELKF